MGLIDGGPGVIRRTGALVRSGSSSAIQRLPEYLGALAFVAASKIPIVGVGSVEMKVVDHEPPVARGDDGLSVAEHDGSVERNRALQSALGCPSADHALLTRKNAAIWEKERAFDRISMSPKRFRGRQAVGTPEPECFILAPR